MDTKEIWNIYKNILSSISFDDLSYSEINGEFLCALSVQMKAVNAYIEGFKNADPYSIVLSWNNECYNYLKSKNPFKISIKGNIITAVFKVPFRQDIDNVVYHAAYLCSLMDLYNFILDKKGIKTFDIGIGISTSSTRFDQLNGFDYPIFYNSIDIKSEILAINALHDGYERILIDDCTQFNLNDLICFGDKKYKDVGIKHDKINLISDDFYGYNLNLVDFSKWIKDNDKQI